MSADEYIKADAEVYEALSRGNVTAIVDAIIGDVDWAATTSSAGPGRAPKSSTINSISRTDGRIKMLTRPVKLPVCSRGQ
jgi:hypothetical protein